MNSELRKKYLREKEVEHVYGIKGSTLRQARHDRKGIRYKVFNRDPKTGKGGTVHYLIADIERHLKPVEVGN